MKKTIYCLLALLTLLPLSSCNESKDPYDNIDLIPVKMSENGKWSMINSKGDVVYEDEFKERPTMAYNGLFAVDFEKGITVFKQGKKGPEPVKNLEKLKDAGYLSEGLMPVTFNKSRITIVNNKGDKKFELGPVKGHEVIQCAGGYEEGLLWFCTDEHKFGFFDTSGKVKIEPKFDEVNPFNEGLAIIGKYDDGDMRYSVIDKKGQVVFKLKEGYRIEGTKAFRNGHLLCSKEDRYYLFNKKGENEKLPGKIYDVNDFNGKYIIFEEDGSSDKGVADTKGEVLIRAKYSSLTFGKDDTFIAQKNRDDDDVVILDKNGEEKERVDYEALLPLGKWGYVGKEGDKGILLNDKFEKKNKDEYAEIGWGIQGITGVSTDYFNVDAVAQNMVNMIDGNKVCNMTLGYSVSSVMSGEDPRYYTYKSTYNIDSARTSGFRYTVTAQAMFTATMADYDWDYYNSRYYWNPKSLLGGVQIEADCESSWGKEGQKALCSALDKAGFRLIKQDDLQAVYKKGKILAYASSGNYSAKLLVADTSLSDLRGIESELVSSIGSSSSTDYDDSDSVYVEEAVVEVAEDTTEIW